MEHHESMKFLGSKLVFPILLQVLQESHQTLTERIRENPTESSHRGAGWLRKIALTVKSTQTPFLYL